MAAFMGRVEGHRGESREIEVSVQDGLEPPRDKARFDIVAGEIASGRTRRPATCGRWGEGSSSSLQAVSTRKRGDRHPWAPPLDAIAEAA